MEYIFNYHFTFMTDLGLIYPKGNLEFPLLEWDLKDNKPIVQRNVLMFYIMCLTEGKKPWAILFFLNIREGIIFVFYNLAWRSPQGPIHVAAFF